MYKVTEIKKAKWIWCKENTKVNDWVLFKKDFTHIKNENNKNYILKISADTRYFLYINKKVVVMDGSLYRADKQTGYCDYVNITKHLKNGNNTLEILVWHYGNGGRNNIIFLFGALIFECEQLGLYSDRETLCVRHPAFYETQEPYPSYLYGGYNIGYNANNEMLNFNNATEYANYKDKKYGILLDRPLPLFKFSKIKKCKFIKENNKYIIKLPFMMQVFSYFKVYAKGGEKIELLYDRYLVNGGPGDHLNKYTGHRTEYICKRGINEFINYDWYSAENLEFIIPKGVKIINLGYIESCYDTNLCKIVKTDNNDINILIQKCARTLKVCIRDNFMDCPDRERGQWIGDVSVQSPQVFYSLSNNAVLLLKKAITDFITLKKEDKLVGNVPGENYLELPSQSLNAISEIGMIANYYYFTGDNDIIKFAFIPAVKYLKLWDMDDNGLIKTRQGDWNWTDHLYNLDDKVIENCWYYSALKFALKMSKIIKNDDYNKFLNDRIKSIEDNFDEYFWKGNYYSSNGIVDDRANAMAVLTGLAKADKFEKLKDVLLMVFNSSTYMEGYVCEALCKMGYKEYGIKRLMSRYYNLIKNDNSTLWEDFYILGTKNHAWTGSPLTIIYKYFLGISSQDYFNTVNIKPDFSICSSYNFTMDVKGNKIQFDIRNKKKKILYRIKNNSHIKINIGEENE